MPFGTSDGNTFDTPFDASFTSPGSYVDLGFGEVQSAVSAGIFDPRGENFSSHFEGAKLEQDDLGQTIVRSTKGDLLTPQGLQEAANRQPVEAGVDLSTIVPTGQGANKGTQITVTKPQDNQGWYEYITSTLEEQHKKDFGEKPTWTGALKDVLMGLNFIGSTLKVPGRLDTQIQNAKQMLNTSELPKIEQPKNVPTEQGLDYSPQPMQLQQQQAGGYRNAEEAQQILARQRAAQEIERSYQKPEVAPEDKYTENDPYFQRAKEMVAETSPKLIPAIRTPDGRIFTGEMHFKAYENATKRLGREFNLLPENEGFLDVKGNWLSRAEAFDYASKNKLMRKAGPNVKNYLMSEDLQSTESFLAELQKSR